MKLYGIGTDIVKVNRIKKLLKKDKFITEFLTMKKLKDVKELKIFIIVFQDYC